MVDTDITTPDSQPLSRRKNLIGGIDDAHLAMGIAAVGIGIGILNYAPKIQEWIATTFKMPPAQPNGQPANGGAQPQQQPVPPPPAVLPVPNQEQPPEKELPYPYLRRSNIAPVGQAVSVSAMERVPEESQSQPQQKRVGYDSPFGANIAV